MDQAMDFVDRSARRLMQLAALLHIVCLLSFAWMLALATDAARAEEPACTGKDLTAQLEANAPAEWQAIEAQAAATPNGSGLLWRIDKDGLAPSYLFGTMHVTDSRVTTLPAKARTAFDGATTIVIETTEVLDEASAMAALMRHPDLMMFTDDTTLTSFLSEADARVLEDGLARRGIPAGSVAKMKPWIIAAMVALPSCELARKASGAPVLDVKLGKEALAKGKALVGLETVASQLQAMASLPMAFHVRGLVETLRIGDRMDDVIETMVVLYARGETGMFWPFFRAALPSGDAEEGYARFEETMVTARNATMVASARPLLEKGGAFIAVGALHLPGRLGMIEAIRTAGFTVSAVR